MKVSGRHSQAAAISYSPDNSTLLIRVLFYRGACDLCYTSSRDNDRGATAIQYLQQERAVQKLPGARWGRARGG